MPKRTITPLEDKRIILRMLEEGDLPLTLSWRNKDHIRKWFLNTDEISEEKHYAWFLRYKELDTDFVFIILAKELGDLPVGQISLYGVDWQAGNAEYGRLLIGNPAAMGKGFGRQATRLLLEYGFEQMGLKEIHLDVKDGNEPAIAIYKAAGFIEKSRINGLITMSIKHPFV
jgi:RimJ/RimL family protein N-acetyltransferase